MGVVKPKYQYGGSTPSNGNIEVTGVKKISFADFMYDDVNTGEYTQKFATN